MKQLVIKYSVGDGCTYSCEVVLPLLYESVDQALFDLELSIENHIKQLNQYRVDYDKWEERGRILSNKKEKKEGWYQEHYKNRPKDIEDSFKFGNLNIHYSNFYYRDDEKLKPNMPDIFTVEEWYKNESN